MQPGAYFLDNHVRNHPLAHGELRGQLLYKGEGLRDGHVAEVHYRKPAHGDGQGLLFEALSAAVGAGILAQVLLVLLAHALALRVAVAALDAVHKALEGLAEHALAARGVVLELERLAVRAVHERVHGLAGQVLYRRRELEAVLLRQRVVVHLGDGVGLGVAPAGGLDAALEYAEVGVADYELRVGAKLRAEAGAGRAGAVGAVEGKAPGRELVYGYAAVLAGVVLREELLLARGDVVHEHEPAGEARRRLRAVREAARAVGAHDEAVDDYLDIVLFVLVEGYLLAEVVDGPVHARADIAALARVLEDLGVLALARAHDGGQDLDARALRPGHDLVDNLVYGLLAYLLAALRAVRDADTRPEEAQVVVYLRHRAHGGARVAARRLLVYAYGGAEALDVVHVGLVHLPEEHARVAREALDIAALALGVYRVEGERALAGAGEAGEHDELVARYLEVDILEVVLPRALYKNAVSHGNDLPR